MCPDTALVLVQQAEAAGGVIFIAVGAAVYYLFVRRPSGPVVQPEA